MKTAETVSALVGQTLGGVLDDLSRAQTLLREGVAGLTTSFHAFRQQLQVQHQELSQVSKLLEGADGGPGFIEHMGAIVGRFVDDLVHVSASSVRLVERVEEMGADIEKVVHNVDRIESLANETRFIALNARIEAHRAGASGRTFRVVADEVKALADDATGFSAHIRELVARTHGRLDEARTAVSELASHDMNGALEAQQQVLKALAALSATNERVSASLSQVDHHIGQTVRALQFEDMVSQILDSAKQRLAAVRTLWLEWAARSRVGLPEGLDEVASTLEAALSAETVVKQDSMNAGSVELFERDELT
jgi:methyl-accepting chemotaxis protein